MDRETRPLPVRIQQHSEHITFDVVDMANHQVVLGIPWLEEHNPRINWKTHSLEFDGCGCAATFEPRRRQSSTGDEQRDLYLIEEQKPANQRKCQYDSPIQQISDKRIRINEARSKEHQRNSNSSTEQVSEYPREYQQWSKLFEERNATDALPKHEPWDHEIPLIPGKTPPFGPLYKHSAKELKFLKEYLAKQLKMGVIRKSTSPAASPMLFVPKKNGELRPCVDYRKLNEVTIKNRYPLPSGPQLRDRLGTAKWFTTIDLRDGYNQVRMKEGEEWKTAFRTRYGLYEYLVMPFGLTNAPATFQELVNDTLHDIMDEYVVAYLDDILVFTDGGLDQHKEHVKQVISRLASRNLRIKVEKCAFHKKEVPFLGHIVGIKGIRMDPKKIEAIRDWPVPKTVKEVQGFLGFANFNRHFIEKYSHKAEPLTRLTRQNERFYWGPEQQQAFNTLKSACTTQPVLRLYDPKRRCRIETDASDLAIGACLTQEYEGKWHPVAYFSRKMSPAEQNYGIGDKELLAIVASLKEWRIYCDGAVDLDILTDHKNLLNFVTTKELNRRQVRWSEELGQFKFKIRRIKGSDNGRADALSRRFDYMEREKRLQQVLKVNQDGSLSPNFEELGLTTRLLEDEEEEFPISTNKIHIPQERIRECIREHHDPPEFGHPGISNTMDAIKRSCHFDNMKKHVREYIMKCTSCQRNKHSTKKKLGYPQPLEYPTGPWESVSMDFITKLPKSKDPVTSIAYDAIWVIVDRHTKWTHILPFKETYTAEDLENIWQDRLVRIKGEPMNIVSDRDKLFVSSYWRTMRQAFGVKLKHSTAYHPQTDGQTERANRTIEEYLRHYINRNRDNWVQLLPQAELALAKRRNETTRHSPFLSTYGYEPCSMNKQPVTENAKALIRQAMIKNATRVQPTNEPQLKKGDKVYLHNRNFRTPGRSKKLDPVKDGPFVIEEVLGRNNARLQLPPQAQIHRVFHVSLLSKADPSTPVQTTWKQQDDEDREFEVEEIIDQRPGKYLVKWKGYPDSENTWEPTKNLTNCQDKINEYKSSIRGRNRTDDPRFLTC